jgi:LPXTG-site transpeptidase (sortase) family protein
LVGWLANGLAALLVLAGAGSAANPPGPRRAVPTTAEAPGTRPMVSDTGGAATSGYLIAPSVSAGGPAELPAVTAELQPTVGTTAPAVRYVRTPLPARLSIRSIDVDAPIAPVGLEPSGIMASPTDGHVVGWYELGPRPGEPSNAVMAGHVDWQRKLAVFFRLRELEPGDSVEVRSYLGNSYRYIVEDVRSYRANTAPVSEIFGGSRGPTLTLITCGGDFDMAARAYVNRVVVRARGA